jgi:hypothetical protein
MIGAIAGRALWGKKMRKFLASVLIAAQLAAAPAMAADLVQDRSVTAQEAGTFAGVRLRLALGESQERSALRAGLVMAPTLRTRNVQNEDRLRFGEGVELGFRGDRPLALSIAGRPLAGEAQRRLDRRAGISTIGWVAIGVGAVVVLILAAGVTCQETNCLGSE